MNDHLPTYYVLLTMQHGQDLTTQPATTRVVESGTDYMHLLDVVRTLRITRYRHLTTGEIREVSEQDLVPSLWTNPKLYHWLQRSTATPWCWAVIVKETAWPYVTSPSPSQLDSEGEVA